MGGYGSGTWARWYTRQTVEGCLSLNLSRLIRQGCMVPGRRVTGALTWTSCRTGETVASVGFESDMADPADTWLRLQYWRGETAMAYRIYLDTTHPHFGGQRWWFICPITGERATKLHLPAGQTRFASRRAHGLSYLSQRQHRPDRLAEKAHALREKIGGEPGFGQLLPPKPKGMHWRTFEGIIEEIFRLEDASMSAMACRLSGDPEPRRFS